MSKKSIQILIPSGITSIRIILAPILFFTVINNFILYSICIFVLAVATDAIDGYVSRKLDIASSKGAYFDVVADFILILSAFSGLVITGLYPFWLIIIIVFMFLQFIITSKFRIPVYDPIGKYYGSFLFIVIFISLIVINPILYFLLTILIVIFTVISITSRFLFMLKNKDDKLDKKIR